MYNSLQAEVQEAVINACGKMSEETNQSKIKKYQKAIKKLQEAQEIIAEMGV